MRIASSPPGYAECPVETGASSLLAERGIDISHSTDLSDELIRLTDLFVERVCKGESSYDVRFARKFGILTQWA